MVSLTDAAIKQLTESVGPTDVVRIGVKGGGCSGLSYFMSVEEQSDEDDTLVEYENLSSTKLILYSVSFQKLTKFPRSSG